MAEDDNPLETDPKNFKPGLASQSYLSLSQAILAPLDALFKAQIHGARSFLSLVLQIGTPHIPLQEDGTPKPEKDWSDEEKKDQKRLFQQEFYFKTEDENRKMVEHTLSVPALALVPITPLAIDEAEFEFEYHVSYIAEHQQMQDSRIKKDRGLKNEDAEKRPWYLVEEPVSLRGVLAPKSEASKNSASEESRIKIKIKVGKQLTPAGLDKLITTVNQVAGISKNKQ